ncbi:hypothetical protein MCOR27_002870 [Pyricularia oryzae]|nr:hypothetical protein MCOR01_007847 [Pyricularia oryzae]KAH9433498.1 hypothetical protein MCOR02_005546 [Pyricularia oryzae]KAI6284315.1 hypothetical protein MCOR27_002870 [Pyricularia oryzae]KAI6305378.1 hypothetical protein MCOR29_010505 [Pyricularia oryzae]KAI6306067.1 hypothetical protein MCOR34_008242 [Pyricularia oryzae]
MPAVTELALLAQTPKATPATTADFLQRVRTETETWTRRPGTVRYLRAVDDPNAIYIVGQWATVAEHMEGFIPSPGNQELLREGAELFELGDLFLHFDADVSSTLRGEGEEVEITRYVLREGPGRREVVDEAWGRVLAACGAEGAGRVGGGWRLDGLDEGGGSAGEFVVFRASGVDGDVGDRIGSAAQGFDVDLRDCVLRKQVIRAVEVYPAKNE